MRSRASFALPAVLALLAAQAPALAGASAPVPYDVQLPLLLKALTYDRNLKARVGDNLRIAVALPPKGGGDDVADLRSALGALPDRTVNGLPVTFKEVAGDESSLQDALRGGRWAAVYVLPGFSRAEIDAVKRVCAARQVLAAAAQVDDVERGIAFGVGASAGRPQLVVNLPAMKAVGSEFDLAFLRLARVIQ